MVSSFVVSSKGRIPGFNYIII